MNQKEPKAEGTHQAQHNGEDQTSQASKDGSWTDPFFKVLNPAIRAVPAVRWALGVAGVMAAAALGFSFFHSPVAALLGAAAMIVLMVLLRVFANIAEDKDKVQLKGPAAFMTWSIVVLFVLSGSGIFSCAFFRWPRPYPELIGDILGGARQAPIVEHDFSKQSITPDQLPDDVKE
jgi:hypothetical protein